MTATQRDGVKQMQNGDPIWERIRNETRDAARLSRFWPAFFMPILNHEELECALSFHSPASSTAHRAGNDVTRSDSPGITRRR